STASTLFLVRLVGRTSRGRALGLYNAVGGAGGLLGTLLGGWMFVSFGVHFAYLIAALTIAVGAVLLFPIPYHMFLVPHVPRTRRVHRSPGPVPVSFDTLPKIPR
ncbi:MAG TPA: MFS transporter, partial [Thermoplasmata archaeon]|nr:MFS transporter [Thermoplasmata archaeon]